MNRVFYNAEVWKEIWLGMHLKQFKIISVHQIAINIEIPCESDKSELAINK